MAFYTAAIDLSSPTFPFATQLAARTVIVPQIDQDAPNKGKNTPHAYYMHNVLPSAQGYQSVGYDQVVDPISPAALDFNNAFPLQNSDLNRFLFSPSGGKNYIFDRGVNSWASVSPIPTGTFGNNATPMVTTAFVQGQSYICYSGYGVFKYNDVTKHLDTVVFTGLTLTKIKGICAANGYMIVWDDTSLAWSNSLNPTDFVPSVITGAGGGSLNEAKGAITVILPISGGIMAYCEKNIVAGTYTSNAFIPYAFLEVAGSSGVTDPEQISWQANLEVHFVWTSSGLEQIALTGGANRVFPDVTEFLAKQLFEDFDEVTLTFSSSYLPGQLATKVTIVENNFLVISYGITAPDFTHALVFDIALTRWGKLKIPHRDCFQWNTPNFYGQTLWFQLGSTTWVGLGSTTWNDFANPSPTPELPRKTFAFLQADGTIKTVNFDYAEVNSAGIDANGVLLLGKFQYIRNNFLVHQYTSMKNIRQGHTFDLHLFPTLDGDTFLSAVATRDMQSGPLTVKKGRMYTGQNISLLFTGSFNLISAVMTFTVGGEY